MLSARRLADTSAEPAVVPVAPVVPDVPDTEPDALAVSDHQHAIDTELLKAAAARGAFGYGGGAATAAALSREVTGSVKFGLRARARVRDLARQARATRRRFAGSAGELALAAAVASREAAVARGAQAQALRGLGGQT